MASKVMLQTLRPISTIRPYPRQQSFITFPGTEATHFSQTRILSYSHTSLYALIADIDSYSSFLPYCKESKVTDWSMQDKNGKSWPAKANLTVGWGGYEETFTSKLFCIPNSVVEALGGDVKTNLPGADLEHYSSRIGGPTTANNVFKSLSTRWTIRPLHYKPPLGQPQTGSAVFPVTNQTEVNLTIDFQFSNPVYSALSKAVAPEVAIIMIEAFERRAKMLLGGPGTTI